MMEKTLQTLEIEKLIAATFKMGMKPTKTLRTTKTQYQLVVKGRLKCTRLVQAWYANGLVSLKQVVALLLSLVASDGLHLTVTMDLTKTQ